MPTPRVLGGVAMAAAVIGLTVPTASATDISDTWVTPLRRPRNAADRHDHGVRPRHQLLQGPVRSRRPGQPAAPGQERPAGGQLPGPKHTRPGWYTRDRALPAAIQTTARFRVVKVPKHAFSGFDRGSRVSGRVFSGLDCDDDFGPVGGRSTGR